MKKGSYLLIAIAVSSMLLGLAACKHEALKESANVADIIPVKTTAVQEAVVTDPIEASGFVSSSAEARLSFKTGGIIQRILVDDGDDVHSGQLLATLNLTEINSMVNQAQQGVEKAQRDYDRAKHLYEDTVASLEQFQNASTALTIAKQQLEAAKFNQSYSEIRATQPGKIIKKLMNEGEVVSPGLPIFYMTSSGPQDWLVKVGIPDKDWARLSNGNKATVHIDAFPDQQFNATVSNLAQAPDPTSGLYIIELKLDPAGRKMASGLFAKTNITVSNSSTYRFVPIDAIIEGEGKDAFVFTVQNNKALKVPVHVAFIKDGKAMITSGLEQVNSVVVDGSAYLRDGSEVKVY